MKKRSWPLVLSLATVILLVAVLSYLAFFAAMKAETNVRYYGLQNSVAMQLYKTIAGMEMSATNVFNEVEKNLTSPEAAISALERESNLNPDVRGYFAAFEPNYFKEKGTWFEPYVHHNDSSKFEMTQVGSARHDYTKSPWYVRAKNIKMPFWCDPYYYYDGTNISGHYTTFVKPVYDANDKKIDKGNLSMGEKQLFASAILGALVEETEIEFPVFIDSPMQKLDPTHAKNILTKFYPSVSRQVVFFPLLLKELTEEEYSLIEDDVNQAYLIFNGREGSHFEKVMPCELFEKYKETLN